MEQTTATGFCRWLYLFEQEANDRKTDHYYLASLCSEIACLPFLVWGKEPPKELRDLKTFLLTFGTSEEIEKKSEAAALQRAKQDALLSKSIWATALGFDIGPDGRLKPSEGTPAKTRTLPRNVRSVLDVMKGDAAQQNLPESNPGPQKRQQTPPVARRRRKTSIETN